MSGSTVTLEKKENTKNGIKRLIFAGIAIILEAALLIFLFLTGFDKYLEALAICCRVLALILVLAIYSQNKSASIKMPWIILILVFPVVGVCFYAMVGLSGSTAKMRKRYEAVDSVLMPFLKQDEQIKKELGNEEPSCLGVSDYITRESGYPVYRNDGIVYFNDAGEAIEAQKQAMKEAKKFIFMEYFAIEDAESWAPIEDILAEKAREGLDVRVFYDDFGSIGFINTDFAKKLEGRGIHCRIFNPMIPLFNLFLNNRDHRKMTIIDGKIGFTGGYNIANEYFNVTSPYGHWKDTGVRMVGEPVKALTATYLEMWNAVRADDKDDKRIADYFTSKPSQNAEHAPEHGFIQFYADNPIDKKPVGEDVYLNLICQARDYLYIMTPYLIITDEMSRVLGLAAKRGVDVRLITPGIPDKKIVYQVTRSYYNGLARNGVRIFEYTPGFCHAKMFVTDDKAATCGTINMDYRSLYHHFECGCLMIDCDTVEAIRDDFDRVFPECQEVTEKYRSGRSAMLRLGQLVLRLFAPLM